MYDEMGCALSYALGYGVFAAKPKGGPSPEEIAAKQAAAAEKKAAAAKKKADEAAKAAKADDDEDDFDWGDDGDDQDEGDDEDGPSFAEKKMASMSLKERAELAQKMKKAEERLAKKEAAQKMQVILEVKPWEAEQDLKALWKKIVDNVKVEGAVWGEGCTLVDVAFGIQKIVMSVIVGMDVVMDDITDPIEAMEDDVQSCGVASMNVL